MTTLPGLYVLPGRRSVDMNDFSKIEWGVVDDGLPFDDSKYNYTRKHNPVQILDSHGEDEILVIFGRFTGEETEQILHMHCNTAIVDAKDLHSMSHLCESMKQGPILMSDIRCLDFWSRTTVSLWLHQFGYESENEEKLVTNVIDIAKLGHFYGGSIRPISVDKIAKKALYFVTPSDAILCTDVSENKDLCSTEVSLVKDFQEVLIAIGGIPNLDILMETENDCVSFVIDGIKGHQYKNLMVALADAIMKRNEKW